MGDVGAASIVRVGPCIRVAVIVRVSSPVAWYVVLLQCIITYVPASSIYFFTSHTLEIFFSFVFF